jgi:hypothetical protein
MRIGCACSLYRQARRISTFEFLKREMYSIVSNNRAFEIVYSIVPINRLILIHVNCRPVHVTIEQTCMCVVLFVQSLIGDKTFFGIVGKYEHRLFGA